MKFRSSTLIKRIIRKHCPLVSSSIRRIFYKLSSEKKIYIYICNIIISHESNVI